MPLAISLFWLLPTFRHCQKKASSPAPDVIANVCNDNMPAGIRPSGISNSVVDWYELAHENRMKFGGTCSTSQTPLVLR